MQSQADEKGKVFVGGLSWDTNNYSMLKYFSKYGDVIDCVVMKNPDTGKSRGFGFVTFKDINCVDVVLATKHHILDGRQIDPKACNPRSMNKGSKSLENSKRKVFIGGLPVNVSEQQLADLFKHYGPVEEVVIMLDQHKQRSRGFGFLTFEEEESVDNVVKEHFIQVHGKQVEVKRAEPRDLKLLSDEQSTPSLQMGSLFLTPSPQTPLSLYHLQPPIIPSPIGLIAQEAPTIFTHNHPQHWNTATHNGLQLINSNSPIVLIAAPDGGSVGMTPSPSTPLTYQFWNPPSDPRLTFLTTPTHHHHHHHDHQASLYGGHMASGFVHDGCSVITNLIQEVAPLITNNHNNNNLIEAKSNIEIHNNNNINISNYIEATNNIVDHNNNNIIASNNIINNPQFPSIIANQIPLANTNNNNTNNNNNSCFVGLSQPPLFTIHPSIRNHSSTVPAFHPYRR